MMGMDAALVDPHPLYRIRIKPDVLGVGVVLSLALLMLSAFDPPDRPDEDGCKDPGLSPYVTRAATPDTILCIRDTIGGEEIRELKPQGGGDAAGTAS